MKLRRVKFVAVSVFVTLSLVVSSFAAPLCACLETTAEKSHECCEKKMKMHCPMDGVNAASLDKNSHSNCECSVEKRENSPAKISGKKFADKDVVALLSPDPPQLFIAEPETSSPLFVPQNFGKNTFHIQAPARAPPSL